MKDTWGRGFSDNMSQAFLDEVGHQDLRSLLILHQNIVRRSDLVALETIQQCNADHSRWRGEKKTPVIKYEYKSLALMFDVIGSNSAQLKGPVCKM